MGRLSGLDVLRGLAALVVVAYHVSSNYFGFSPGKAYLAVDFFFMLSGYVMARSYEGQMVEGLPATRFFAIRYQRFWPMMAAGSLIGICVSLAEPHSLVPLVIGSIMGLALVPLLGIGAVFPLNPPAWSILMELTANVVHVIGRRLVAPMLAISLLGLVLSAASFGTYNRG